MSTLIASATSNGVFVTQPTETCLQRIARETGNYHQEFWLEALLYCRIPANAPADEWPDGIARVKACADNLIRKTAL